ncbi:hypothetical protein R69927_03972 [Paraburkholderia domus]|jgi:hypothetical protein|uniref:Uncharacterized protein n=1 Tax=Paraburkholderia domus TaxID=2793075 RepID=A0A9N8QXY5_9BURK|nr:hypothetical protein R75483_02661 [Paraburkholderia domus]CAE6773614.1 hypothetical protein R70006_04076 [Paraburkholderia domus]CAE6785511.1 hypothetical protein R69749_01892 [Paraburkholderia domus]CAE6877050.1 hypothetical protein R69927_03972 [Paraburkholderia domus]CAE6883607.1 hypothetical protein R70199_02679 [Paraburkholderia domus]
MGSPKLAARRARGRYGALYRYNGSLSFPNPPTLLPP